MKNRCVTRCEAAAPVLSCDHESHSLRAPRRRTIRVPLVLRAVVAGERPRCDTPEDRLVSSDLLWPATAASPFQGAGVFERVVAICREIFSAGHRRQFPAVAFDPQRRSSRVSTRTTSIAPCRQRDAQNL